jgi:hypothetical protein
MSSNASAPRSTPRPPDGRASGLAAEPVRAEEMPELREPVRSSTPRDGAEARGPLRGSGPKSGMMSVLMGMRGLLLLLGSASGLGARGPLRGSGDSADEGPASSVVSGGRKSMPPGNSEAGGATEGAADAG